MRSSSRMASWSTSPPVAQRPLHGCPVRRRLGGSNPSGRTDLYSGRTPASASEDARRVPGTRNTGVMRSRASTRISSTSAWMMKACPVRMILTLCVQPASSERNGGGWWRRAVQPLSSKVGTVVIAAERRRGAMGHALELFFDPTTEAAIRDVWARLETAGLPSLASRTHRRGRPGCGPTAISVMGGSDRPRPAGPRRGRRRDPCPVRMVQGAGGTASVAGRRADVHSTCQPR